MSLRHVIPTETIPVITLKNGILRRGAKVLLGGASLPINPGKKVGLVCRHNLRHQLVRNCVAEF